MNYVKFDYTILPEGAKLCTPVENRLSDSERHYFFLKQLTHDGVEINGFIENEDNIPSFQINIEGIVTRHCMLLFPKAFQFLLLYLLTGDNRNFPKYPKDLELSDFRTEDDYLYKHIKREIGRGTANYTYNEEKQDNVNGIRFIGLYPYGSLDYGFFPYSWEELNAQLENIEPFEYIYPEYDIPELHNTNLPIEYRDIVRGQNFNSVFKSIPTNAIIDKTICGCGATWLEINDFSRHSIIIEPNVPVIIGKEQKHTSLPYNKERLDFQFEIEVQNETQKYYSPTCRFTNNW